jgi:protein-L-isoaspartate(D-aspartate) O-methyltransferase
MTVHSPIPDFAAARAAMVENQLRPQGVTDPAVLDAMGSVPRENFLPPETRPLAYVDRAVSMGDRRFLPAPAVLGSLLGQMMPVRGERALVVGAGTG